MKQALKFTGIYIMAIVILDVVLKFFGINLVGLVVEFLAQFNIFFNSTDFAEDNGFLLQLVIFIFGFLMFILGERIQIKNTAPDNL